MNRGDKETQADDLRPLRTKGNSCVTSSGHQEAAPQDLSCA
jgi:hypothetical protein